MADVVMPRSVPCRFDEKGWHPCKKPSTNGWCSKHEGLKCSNCRKRAVTRCDAEMGGLMCGCVLCAICEHNSESGRRTHITKRTADRRRENARREKATRIASRTNPDRRMDKRLDVPVNLFELMKGDWKADGFVSGLVYCLELRHGLMGFFPAIFSAGKKRIVFVTDLQLLERVWVMLDPCEARINEVRAYIHPDKALFYVHKVGINQEEEVPRRLLTENEFDKLAGQRRKKVPFEWAPGLLGGRSTERGSYLADLCHQAKQLDPRFKTKLSEI